ncbi:MAG: sugar transferase [candidate division KSB1 bacterium]|nr:sugar transferase [candidate division KSB1 bacterium]MDZ7276137.1 sugar transferase [candidate division KSB1 bacterium]MDZ7287083.1 sugar transferase [candidate division KSB1 bacterium]MDZ7296992.1 sugar transferase [candidate division KSB1 bacterium]MDZ7306178.1 sugar transferase [candidate division KSB1 bacterium]
MQGAYFIGEMLPPATALVAAQEEKPWYLRGPVRNKVPGSNKTYQVVKRGMDLIISLAALPVVLLLLGLCAIAIRIDSPGPVFFFQYRTGRGGRRFKMYKLRTMVENAEQLKEKYLHLNLLTWPDFKIANDPRITCVGKFLRKTSLDELPQIFNVLRGEMSLVGPRPTSFSASTYSLWHTARLELKPGLTGLWQVCGRNEIDFDERCRLDIAYMRYQSLWLDLQIMFRTVSVLFTGRGAN